MRVPGGENCFIKPGGPLGHGYTNTKWSRKTLNNEYAVEPELAKDYTESRLHPATVLRAVEVTTDRPAPVAEIFADFAEARQMCDSGCRIVALEPSFDQGSPRFAVFPKNPTDEQRAWALRVTSHMPLSKRPDDPAPVIYFYWEKKQACTHFDNSSLEWPILRFEFSVADTSFPQQLISKPESSPCRERGLTDFGEFRGGVLGGIIGGTDSSLPPPPKIAPTRIRVGGDVQAAKMVRQVPPTYPAIAKTAHTSGTVVLHAIIGKDGTIQDLQYISGPPLLMHAAMDAVRQWRYQPTLLNGEPVEVDTTISVVFAPGG